MACNWLMMTSSGDDNRPSGSLGLLTDKTKKKKNKINRRQSKKPPAQPTAARFNYPSPVLWHGRASIPGRRSSQTRSFRGPYFLFSFALILYWYEALFQVCPVCFLSAVPISMRPAPVAH